MRDNPSDNLRKMEKKLKSFISWVEIILAIFIIGAVLISCKDIIVLIYDVFITEPTTSYHMLQGLLSHILLVVVGLELALMLITHSASNVLEVMLYAIARKMLISSTNTMDIMLGVLSIALIFVVDKYLNSQRNL